MTILSASKTAIRAKILEYLLLVNRQEIYGSALAEKIGVAPAVVSRSVRSLVSDGYVNVRNVGAMRFYSINSEKIKLDAEKLIEKISQEA